MPEVDLLKQAAISATVRKVHDPQAKVVVAAHVVCILRAKVHHLADDTVCAVGVAIRLAVSVLGVLGNRLLGLILRAAATARLTGMSRVMIVALIFLQMVENV